MKKLKLLRKEIQKIVSKLKSFYINVCQMSSKIINTFYLLFRINFV